MAIFKIFYFKNFIFVRNMPKNLVFLYQTNLKLFVIFTKTKFWKNFICQIFSQILERLMIFDGKSMNRALSRNFVGDPYKKYLSQLNFRNRKANIHERLKCNRYMIAIDFRTLNCWHELPMHQVYNYWLRSFQMILPGFKTRLLIVHSIILYFWNQRFFLYSIQVLVETIEYNV